MCNLINAQVLNTRTKSIILSIVEMKQYSRTNTTFKVSAATHFSNKHPHYKINTSQYYFDCCSLFCRVDSFSHLGQFFTFRVDRFSHFRAVFYILGGQIFTFGWTAFHIWVDSFSHFGWTAFHIQGRRLFTLRTDSFSHSDSQHPQGLRQIKNLMCNQLQSGSQSQHRCSFQHSQYMQLPEEPQLIQWLWKGVDDDGADGNY